MTRLKLIIALFIISTSSFSPINAATTNLSDIDKGFVVTGIVSVMMSLHCKANLVNGGMLKLAERFGIDSDPLNRAVMATMKAQSDQPYDSNDLIPSVTTLILSTYADVQNELQNDKIATCSKYINLLQRIGVAK